MKRSCHLYEMSESKETVKEEENKEKKRLNLGWIL